VESLFQEDLEMKEKAPRLQVPKLRENYFGAYNNAWHSWRKQRGGVSDASLSLDLLNDIQEIRVRTPLPLDDPFPAKKCCTAQLRIPVRENW
jgi:hypothetical protein